MTKPKTVDRDSATAANPKAGRHPSASRRSIGLVSGVVVFIGMLLMDAPAGMSEKAWITAAVGILMAIWWVLEAIPIPATSLVPLLLFPLLGVKSMTAAAAPYANPLIFMFFGGFILALAMERWNLQRRIALNIVRWVGTNPAALVAGFMGATAFLSMWVSNTATAAMMLPIGLSVIALLGGDTNGGNTSARTFGPALLLGIAYGASIGGVGTLIGTPPNALLAGYFSQTYKIQIGFADWMIMAVPLEIIMLVVAWIVLTRIAFPLRTMRLEGAAEIIRKQIDNLGPISRGEAIIATIFVITATLWTFQPLINSWIPGLKIGDTEIAIFAALAIFMTPVEPRNKIFLLDWTATQNLPWGVLLLFGGGLSLGAAILDTGLSKWIADSMSMASDWPSWVMVVIVVLAVMTISHFTSNTATAAAFLPLTAALAISLGENPLYLAIPTALAASFVFMLPVATPPNAMVFASGQLTVAQMAKAGSYVNVIAIIVILVMAYTLMGIAFGVEAGVMPDWARPHG
ncbi:MAG: DASS family sodium-coupled anion symporter [Rhodospirillales bacterium]|nr:DASS family sodium-coupled anion symporter [Rhodospirillales bacterium]